MRMTGRLGDERGVALPMAMISLVLITTLMMSFAVLAQTEPIIAANQLRVSQARALAESGFERAIWALSQGVINPGTAGSIDTPMPSNPAPAPYGGNTFVAVNATGGFVVRVTNGATADQRLVQATGWTPTNDPAVLRTKAHRVIQATVERLPDLAVNAPCALCVKGDLDVTGNSSISALQDTSCGAKRGSYTSGTTTRSASSTISGADGNATANEAGSDYVDNQDPATFDGFTVSNLHLDKLKELAKKNGTYFQGTVAFNSANKVNNGIVFVDTVSGTNIPLVKDLQNPDDFASVTISGNPFVSGEFTGWIVVNGSLAINGSMKINGTVYAVNDLTYNGTGTGAIEGLVISQNIRDTSQTAIDTSATGNSKIKFDCAKARNRDWMPQGYWLVAGTYREVAD